MAQQAIGLIETIGLVPALAAADAAAKAANVRIVRRLKMKGSPYTTVLYEGDIGAVQAAIEAGAAVARTVGTLLSTNVIPRPADGLDTVLGSATPPSTAAEAPAAAPRKRRGGDANVGGEPVNPA